MATYSQLAGITEDTLWGEFIDKIRVAAVIKATAIIDSAAPTVEAKAWARDALDNPGAAGDSVVWYVIGSNDSFTLNQILTATDTAIQNNVNAAVDVLYP